MVKTANIHYPKHRTLNNDKDIIFKPPKELMLNIKSKTR